MATSLIAQALIHEVAPQSIEHHVKSRDFLRHQEETDASSLLCSLVTIYEACSPKSEGCVDVTLKTTLSAATRNEYGVGEDEIRLLCLIALRAIWQRQARTLDMTKCDVCLSFLMRRLRECIYDGSIKPSDSEQVITTVTQVSRYLIPFHWKDLIAFILEVLKEMVRAQCKDLRIQTKEFLALLLQFFQVHSSRKIGSAQADFLILFQSTGLLPLLFACWGLYHNQWIDAHAPDPDGSQAEFYSTSEEKHTTQSGEDLDDEMVCLDSIIMIVITHFNKVELLMNGDIDFDDNARASIADLSAQDPSTFIKTAIAEFSEKVNVLLEDVQVWCKRRHIAILTRMVSTVTQRYTYFIPGKSQVYFNLQDAVLAPFQELIAPDRDVNWYDNGYGNALLSENLLRLAVVTIVLSTPRYGWTSKYKSSREAVQSVQENMSDHLELESFWSVVTGLPLLQKIYEYLLAPGVVRDRDSIPRWENLRVNDWLEFCSDFTEVFESLGSPTHIAESFIRGVLSRHSFVSSFFPKVVAAYREHVEERLNPSDRSEALRPDSPFFLGKILEVLVEERWELMAILRNPENEPSRDDGTSAGGSIDPPTPQSDLDSRSQIRYCLNELMLIQCRYYSEVFQKDSLHGELWYEALKITAELSDVATATYNSDWLSKLESLTNSILAIWSKVESRLNSEGSAAGRGSTKSTAGWCLATLCVRHLTTNFLEAIIAIASCRHELGYLNVLNVYEYRGEPEVDEAVWQSLCYLMLEYQSKLDFPKFTEEQYREFLKLIVNDTLSLDQQVATTWGQKFYSSSTLLCTISCLVDPVLTIPDEIRAMWNPIIKVCGMLMNMLDVGYGNRVRKSGEVKFTIPPSSYDASPPVEKTHYQFPSASVSPYLFGTDIETTSLCLLGVRLLLHAIGVLGGHRGSSAYGAEVPVIELHQSIMVKLDATFGEIVIDQMSSNGNKLRPSLLLRAVTDLWLEIVLWIQTNIPKMHTVDIRHHWKEEIILSFLNLILNYFDSSTQLSTSVAADKADIVHRLWRLSHAAIWPDSCQNVIKGIFETHPITNILMHREMNVDTTALSEKYTIEELQAEVRRAPLGLRAEYKRLVDDSIDLSRDLQSYHEAANSPVPMLKKEHNVSIVLSMNNDFTIEIEEEDLSANVPVCNLHSIWHELQKLGLK